MTSAAMLIIGLVLFVTDSISTGKYILGTFLVLFAIIFHRYNLCEDLKMYVEHAHEWQQHLSDNKEYFPIRFLLAVCAGFCFNYYPVHLVVMFFVLVSLLFGLTKLLSLVS